MPIGSIGEERWMETKTICCFLVTPGAEDNQPDDGHELAETCRWLIPRIYILPISSCVIDYFQHT